MKRLGVWLVLASIPGWAVIRVPDEVKQGDTLRVIVEHAREGLRTSFAGRTVRIFRQPDGSGLGFVPVPVSQRPGRLAVKLIDESGGLLESAAVTVVDAQFLTQNIRATQSMKALTAEPGELAAISRLFRTASDERSWAEPFVAPTGACANSPFGVQRLHNGKRTGAYHKGLDLHSQRGTPVRATAAGVVRISRMYRLHGGTIGIDHGQGVTSLYIHLSKLIAADGARVEAGDVVGEVGSTGFSTGPHLHWQVAVNGLPVNPLQWVPSIKPCSVPARRGKRAKGSPRR
ncbi:MAG: M23 family metallopeptidase [Bryobacteraceae bacterium]